jgi:hypothetical protein
MRGINGAKSALAQPAFQAIPGQPGRLGMGLGGVGAQETAGLLMRLEKRKHLLEQRGIVAALPGQEFLARSAGRKFQRAGKQGFGQDNSLFHRQRRSRRG